MEVSMAVYTVRGKGLMLPNVWVGASSYSDFNFNDLLRTAGDEFRSGNIQVKYMGVPDGVTSKVSVSSNM